MYAENIQSFQNNSMVLNIIPYPTLLILACITSI